MISIPLIVVGTSVSLFIVSARNIQKQPRSMRNTNVGETIDQSFTKSKDIYSDVKIFPGIDPYHFYPYLKMKEGSPNPQIDREMISKIVSYIFKAMMITEGNCYWSYYQPTPSEIFIKIIWNHESFGSTYSYDKIYHFVAKK